MKKTFEYEFEEDQPNSLSYEVSLEEDERLKSLVENGTPILYMNRSAMLTMAKVPFTFGYAPLSLYSPFLPETSFGTVSTLQTATNGLNLSTQFQYDNSSSGELSQVTFPLGGHLRWTYRSFTYSGSRTVREIQNRYLAKASGGSETTYTFSHNDSADSGYSVHSWTTLDDPSGIGQRAWFFSPDGVSAPVGFQTASEERPGSGQAALRRQDYTWTQDSAGNPYLASTLTTLDPGTGNAQQSKTSQTIDTHGNVTQTQVFDFGNLSNPARTYNNTYYADTNYTSRNIWNRLLSSTVSSGSQTVTLVSNSYDRLSMTDRTGLRQHDDLNS